MDDLSLNLLEEALSGSPHHQAVLLRLCPELSTESIKINTSHPPSSSIDNNVLRSQFILYHLESNRDVIRSSEEAKGLVYYGVSKATQYGKGPDLLIPSAFWSSNDEVIDNLLSKLETDYPCLNASSPGESIRQTIIESTRILITELSHEHVLPPLSSLLHIIRNSRLSPNSGPQHSLHDGRSEERADPTAQASSYNSDHPGHPLTMSGTSDTGPWVIEAENGTLKIGRRPLTMPLPVGAGELFRRLTGQVSDNETIGDAADTETKSMSNPGRKYQEIGEDGSRELNRNAEPNGTTGKGDSVIDAAEKDPDHLMEVALDVFDDFGDNYGEPFSEPQDDMSQTPPSISQNHIENDNTNQSSHNSNVGRPIIGVEIGRKGKTADRLRGQRDESTRSVALEDTETGLHELNPDLANNTGSSASRSPDPDVDLNSPRTADPSTLPIQSESSQSSPHTNSKRAQAALSTVHKIVQALKTNKPSKDLGNLNNEQQEQWLNQAELVLSLAALSRDLNP